jgi:hypothetical protein
VFVKTTESKAAAAARVAVGRAVGLRAELLGRLRDTFAAVSEVRRFAAAGLDEVAYRKRRGGLVIAALDETGQAKAGTATCGVKRQYMGCAGRVANGINTVHLSYVRERTGHALIGACQWIPAEHVTDPVTSAGMGLPTDLEFRTKGQLAIDICAEAYADGLAFDFACGDEVYGNCTQLREFFAQHGQAYVLRVASSFMLALAAQTRLTCAQAVKERDGGARRRPAGFALGGDGPAHENPPTPPTRPRSTEEADPTMSGSKSNIIHVAFQPDSYPTCRSIVVTASNARCR